ncbi:MAG TPA: hypothetical protein VER08_03525 [Pyrinomonadaceae bacterium]|nr:hypothetical protein [Pyrinomonadaceae bacterium]
MSKTTKPAAVLAAVLTLAAGAYAQRTQSVGEQQTTPAASQQTDGGKIVSPTPPPAPPTVKAKYEGGVIGYKKSDGSLTFDDANRRLLFRDKDNKELFSVPYGAIDAAYADTKSLQPTSARVIGSLPLPYGANIPAWFVRKKYRYLTLNYSDADTHATGLTSFKLDNKELLASVLHTLGQKAGLIQRGDAFIRRRGESEGSTISVPVSAPPDDRPRMRPVRVP